MTANNLPGKISAWLQKEGYPFELQASRTLREAGWSVFHSRHYSDPETGKSREIDLYAPWGPYVGEKNEHAGMVSLHLVCECKVSEKPWVVFTSQTGDGDEPYQMRVQRLRLAPGPFGSRALAHGIVTCRDRLSVLVPNSRIGHGLTKAFTDSRSGDPTGPFAAVAGALSASTAFSARHYSTVFQKRPGQEPLAWIGIYVPIVFLCGRLFEFYLDHNGNEVLEECERLHVLVHGHSSRDDLDGPVAVQVVSASALADFAKAALDETKALARAILPEARALSREFQGGGEETS
jgi:hypothetical protein